MKYKQENTILLPIYSQNDSEVFEYSDFIWEVNTVIYNWSSNIVEVIVLIYKENVQHQFSKRFLFECTEDLSSGDIITLLFTLDCFKDSVIFAE